jgi:hypothetical protein
MRAAPFGSISHGTLRVEDLLETFAEALDSLLRSQPRSFKRAPYRAKIREAYAALRAMETGAEHYADEVVQDLADALSDFAPPYGYFGASEGDGSDFGFWLSSYSLEDFDGLRVSDTSEVPRGYSGEVLHVNDHGNVSLYVATPRGRLREVWAVV